MSLFHIHRWVESGSCYTEPCSLDFGGKPFRMPATTFDRMTREAVTGVTTVTLRCRCGDVMTKRLEGRVVSP